MHQHTQSADAVAEPTESPDPSNAERLASAGAPPMIVFDEVTKVYEPDVVALEAVSLTVETGEFVFLVGASGSGKSTLLRLLLKEVDPSSGRVLVGGRELQKVKNQQLASDFRRLRSKTSLMFQLLIYDALGDWENVNKFSDRIQAVTAEDVQRVVKQYFKPENRSVAIYYTKEGGAARPGPRRGRPRPPGGAQ